jgi:L-rhamnose-H+ transport protein
LPPTLSEPIALVLAAAVMNAVYTLPMKLNRQWKWEHSWLVFTFLGVAVVPTILAAFTIPHLLLAYDGVAPSVLMGMAACGALWGVSLVFFGLAVNTVGVAITFAVALGTSAASGAVIPLISQHYDEIFTTKGFMVFLGIAAIVVGVAMCGRAGRRRDSERSKNETGKNDARFGKGFAYAFLSGVLGSMLNVGLALGAPIQQNASNLGASEGMMSNAVWLPCLYAGAIPGLAYCVFLMGKNGTTQEFLPASRWYYWLTPAAMGLFWFGSIMCYSLASIKLGTLGPVIAWPLFLSAVVVASSIAGVVTGEWKSASRGVVVQMWSGVACLIVAMALLASVGQ